MKLQGKIAVITGGARGIGRAIAESYAKEGARVVIADLLLDEAKETARAIGPDALAVAVDVSKRSSIADMARFVCRFDATEAEVDAVLASLRKHLSNG